MNDKTKIKIKLSSGTTIAFTTTEAREVWQELNLVFGELKWAPPVPAFPMPGIFPAAPPYRPGFPVPNGPGDDPWYQPITCAAPAAPNK